MKLSSLLAFLPMALANGFPGGPGGPGCPSRIPNSVGNATGAEGCCCLTFKASCTMNLERAFHVKLFYNRKKGIAPEEFNDYWANKHSALATNFHLRMGAIRYSQVCCPESFPRCAFPRFNRVANSCTTAVPLHTRTPRSCSGGWRTADP